MWIFNFLHTFQPQPIVFRLGPLTIYWYGLLIILAGLLGYWLTLKLTEAGPPEIQNLIFYLIIFGLIGARIYHVLCELPYYLRDPLAVLKVWQGGLGIFGAVIAGIIVLYFYGRRNKISFLWLADLIAPALILGQAIGRWGNWFNQELYGLPTNLPWGIPISLANRLVDWQSSQYFHPVFLYESIGCLIIFVILLCLHKVRLTKPEAWPSEIHGRIFALYLILYPLIRFSVEFLRINPQPIFFGLRLAQLVAVLMFVAGWVILIKSSRQKKITENL